MGRPINSWKRAAEKQASRSQDEKRLASGEVSRLQLQNENNLFYGFDIPNAKIVRRKRLPA